MIIHEKIKLQSNVSLAPYNTFKLATTARFFAEVDSIEQLTTLYHHPIWKEYPKIFLGSGSNILFTQYHFNGLVVKMSLPGMTCTQENEKHAWIKAGSGENWHNLVLHCISKGYYGMENLSYIPGTAGAAPIQNIGAYGVELKDIFEELEAFHLTEGNIVKFKGHECGFGYRQSVFKQALKDQYAICSITLKLNKFENLNTQYGEIQKTISELGLSKIDTRTLSEIITHIRKNKLPDPAVAPNVGSFFKNPIISTEHFEQLRREHADLPHYPANEEQVKIPAGWLIEKAGWKGKKNGHVGTYYKQALVVINHEGQATGEAILNFANDLQQDVEKKFGIQLTPEVTII